MRDYGRNEYENWDEYEEEGDEQEEEEGYEEHEEETYQPTQEEMDYLGLRQRIKESIRKKMKKELGTAKSGSRDHMSTFRKDSYGSFFGPSQPIIAQRVIQESKSLLENPDLAARITKAHYNKSKTSGTASAGSKLQAKGLPKVTNGLKKKVEILKNTRDYSFLLSDDVEIPSSAKDPQPRNASASKSAGPPLRSKPTFDERARGGDSNGRDGKKQIPYDGQNRSKSAPPKAVPSSKSSLESRMQHSTGSGTVPGRSMGTPRGDPLRNHFLATGKKIAPPTAKYPANGSSKNNPSNQQLAERRPAHANPQIKAPKVTPSHGQAASPVKRPLDQTRYYQESSKPKVVSKQALPSSKPQLKKPISKPPARRSPPAERPRAKPSRRPFDDNSDDENAINMIRQMFRYNPKKYHDDDDDSDMEANFDDILREEDRSAKIARQEDEEQLRLIEEEERREKMRLARKRKMGH